MPHYANTLHNIQSITKSVIALLGLILQKVSGRPLDQFAKEALDNGVWHGRQIVSADWVKQMTTRHSPDGMWFGFARGYGYLWWLGRSSIGRRDIDWVGSRGWGGQRLYAVPS